MSGSVDPNVRYALECFAELFDVTPLVHHVAPLGTSSSFNEYLESSTFAFGSIAGALGAAAASTPNENVVALIRGIENELGLPLKDVLAAAGIKKRTFHSWVSGTARTPQLRSQGQLWQLVDALEDIRNAVQGPMGAWLKSDRGRMALLRAGLLDELVDASLPARTANEYRTSRRGITDDFEMPVISRGPIEVSKIKSDE